MNWWRQLLKRDKLDTQLEAELRFHIDSQVAERIRAGLSEDEARRTVRLQFGGLDQVKEECRDARGTRWVETLIQDLRFALRTLRKSPTFSSVAAVTLALGIGINTAVFTVVNGVLLRPLPFSEPNRLFLVSYQPKQSPFPLDPGLSDRDFLEFLRQDRLFEHLATFAEDAVTLTGAGDPVRVSAAAVTPGFFRALRINPAIGRAFLPDEGKTGDTSIALLSEKLWRSRFGADAHILGKTITLDGVRHTVIGVAPRGFLFPKDAELWTPLSVGLDPHNSYMRPVIGRLRPGVSQQQAQAELEAFASRLPVAPGEHKTGMAAGILPLKDLLVGNIQSSLLIFAGAVGFVLLIACANFANLLLGRAAARQQEIATRAALGAGRWRLIRQLLTESTLVSLAGGGMGVLLAVAAVPGLLALAPAGKMPRLDSIHIDGAVLIFTAAVSVMTGIIFGLAPALGATRRELREPLNQSGRTLTGRGDKFRRALVVSEIALALVLLTGAGLMLKSFLRMRAVDPGFRPENVLTMTVDLPESVYHSVAQIRAFRERTLAQLSKLPGVRAAGAVNWLPFAGPLTRGDFQIDGGQPLPSHYLVDKASVSADYFGIMGIPLLKGRYFTDHDNSENVGVAIVSQSVVKQLWPGEDPIGKRISIWEDHPKPGDWQTIVGVVSDIRQRDATSRPDAAIYQPYMQVTRPFLLSHITFTVRAAANPGRLAPAMQVVLHKVDRNQVVESIATMDNVIASTMAEPRFQTRLLLIFSVLALVLAAIGIYGVLAYSVTQKTHEIGIRMALGANSGDVMSDVLHGCLVLAMMGVALGVAGALALTRVLEKMLFDVKTTDPAIFIGVALLLTAVALFAGWIPARRATKIDPVLALRFE